MIWESLLPDPFCSRISPGAPKHLMVAMLTSVSLLGPSGIAGAQVAEQLADLNPGEQRVPEDSNPGHYHRLGKRVVFFTDRAQGFDPPDQLWVTEGSPETTFSLASSRGGPLAVSDELVYFNSPDGPRGPNRDGLWRTDGSREGTFQIWQPSGDSQFFAGPGIFLGEIFLFSSSDGLWRTDGTVSGTEPLAPVGGIFSLAPYDSGRVLLATSSALWISDGSSAGTRRLAQATDLGRPVVSGEKIFYAEDDSSSAGFRGLRFLPSPAAAPITVPLPTGLEARLSGMKAGAPGVVVFRGFNDEGGGEIWRSDGTAPGTRPITSRSTGFSSPSRFWTREGTTWFTASTQDGDDHFFRVEDSPETQTEVFPRCAGFECFVFGDLIESFGDFFYLRGVQEDFRGPMHWITDGSPAGERPLDDLCRPDCIRAEDAREVVGDGDLLLFGGRVTEDRSALFVTDGTIEGTERITPPGFPQVRSGPGLAELNGVGWILGLDTTGKGLEPWVSSTDPKATRLLADIETRAAGAELEAAALYGSGLVAIANTRIFAEDSELFWLPDGAEPVFLEELPFPARGRFEAVADLTVLVLGKFSTSELLVLSGEPPESTALATISGPVSPFVPWQGRSVFTVLSGLDAGLWETDGTPAGTRLIFDPPISGPVEFSPVVPGPDGLYFLTNDLQGEMRLWRSNGATGEEEALGPLGRSFGFFDDTFLVAPVENGGAVYFLICQDQVQTIWKHSENEGLESLGQAGTCPREAQPSPLLAIGDLIALTSGSEFQAASVWTLNPAAETLSQLIEGRPLLSEDAATILGDNSRLYFPFDDGLTGEELWVTDGTAAGTKVVRDAVPGGASSYPRNLTVVGDEIYYAGYDPVHGVELWVTDGTETGTKLVHDVFPGVQGSFPDRLTPGAGKLYFEADDGISGRELWVLPLDGGPACRASETSLCLQGDRFRVEAYWQDFRDRRGQGQAVQLTQDTGYFWFFNEQNVEAVLKVLDGRANNDHFWSFYGALSNVEYWLTVTDTESGLTRRYYNPLRNFASVGDTFSFGPQGASLRSSPDPLEAEPSPLPEVILSQAASGTAGTCAPSSERLCVNGSRFAVEVDWQKPDGETGTGKAVDLTDDTGYFWFFRDTNVELILKVLDGTANNGHYWVFYGSLSNVDFDVTVTDTMTGEVRTYLNRGREFASVGDTEAFQVP